MARIVSAEDDPDVADLIAFRLGMDGHQVTLVSDARSALDACRRQRPDVVILDIVMPGPIDGLDALRAIRADPRLAGLPVIVLTAHAFRDDVAAGLRAGADVYLTKPFSPRDLSAHVASLLAVRRSA